MMVDTCYFVNKNHKVAITFCTDSYRYTLCHCHLKISITRKNEDLCDIWTVKHCLLILGILYKLLYLRRAEQGIVTRECWEPGSG